MGYGRYGKYPHMLPGEVDIWDRYLDHHLDEYKSFEYDVHVGTPPPPEVLAKYPISIQGAILATYLYRIDVVATRKNNEIEIIEVKEFAGTTALGQVLLYDYLYRRDFKPAQRVRRRIVTDRTTKDLIEVAKYYSVEVSVVEEIIH